MSIEQGAVIRGIALASLGVAVLFAIIACVFFGVAGFVAFLLGCIASFIYFVMLRHRIAAVAPGRKPVAYMIRGLVVRLVFILGAVAVLIRCGFDPLAVLLGVMVTPLGNKLFSLILISRGIKEFTRR